MRAAAACLALPLLVAGCATLRAGGGEGPPAPAGKAVYRIWHKDGIWHVRASPGGARHRFQGSVEGLTGGLHDPVPDRDALRNRVARSRNSIQFDFETDRDEAGFDAPATGGCLRFDLWIDGRRRADRVRFGPRGVVPARLPAVSCP